MTDSAGRWLVLVLAVGLASSSPVAYPSAESHSLGTVSDLGQRLVSHSSLLADPGADARLPLPSPQELEAIKKVAQILVMLGEQHNKRNQKPIEMLNKIVASLTTRKPKTRNHQYVRVIPSLLGDSGAGAAHSNPPDEVPNDPVEAK